MLALLPQLLLLLLLLPAWVAALTTIAPLPLLPFPFAGSRCSFHLPHGKRQTKLATTTILMKMGRSLSDDHNSNTSNSCIQKQKPQQQQQLPTNMGMYVLFGRPGAGKTTVANALVERLSQQQQQQQQQHLVAAAPVVLGLDLDVCVTQDMRDNFAQGIYPTLEERQEFAVRACDHVVEQAILLLQQQQQQDDGDNGEPVMTTVIVSFSFVNTDLRDIFRQRFPMAEWVLIDTKEREADMRIQQRQGHFYKTATAATLKREESLTTTIPSSSSADDLGNNNPEHDDTNTNTSDCNNSNSNSDDWKFAPITFDHTVVDGNDPIADNVEKILALIMMMMISSKSGSLG